MLDLKELSTLAEFCTRGSLKEYEVSLKKIFERIKSSGCRVAARYDSVESSHSFGRSCIIRISLKSAYKEPVHIIWTILHEFGHHISGHVDKGKLLDPHFRLQREIDAWAVARSEILADPKLYQLITEFELFMDECLVEYRLAAMERRETP